MSKRHTSKRTTSMLTLGQVNYPPSVEFANLPTPMSRLEQLSARLDKEIYCKRDDLTGSALSGNKVRKLEFLLAAATDAGATGVITCGGAQSNHARATAIAAARLGLSCKLLLRVPDPATPPAMGGNLLLDRLAGADIEWITPGQYARRDQLMQERAEAADGKLVPIPEGGSNALGAFGYVRCIGEIAEQLGQVPATVLCAVGSGGTMAGLLAGCRLFNLPYRIVGICVADDRATFQTRISGILQEMADQYGLDVAMESEGIEIWEGYVGRGYALSQEPELGCILDLARTEGLVLDPVYSGKAMFGLISEIEQGRELSEPLVFIHTGGIYGLFDKAAELEPLF